MPEIMEDSKQLTEKSVVFINTIEHAETMDLKAVFESIKKQGATVLGISTRKSKYKKYIDQEIMSEENGKIVEDLMMFDIYFYMLSESYRLKYIWYGCEWNNQSHQLMSMKLTKFTIIKKTWFQFWDQVFFCAQIDRSKELGIEIGTRPE